MSWQNQDFQIGGGGEWGGGGGREQKMNITLLTWCLQGLYMYDKQWDKLLMVSFSHFGAMVVSKHGLTSKKKKKMWQKQFFFFFFFFWGGGGVNALPCSLPLVPPLEHSISSCISSATRAKRSYQSYQCSTMFHWEPVGHYCHRL